MGNAALLLKASGDRVSGSDRGIYPPMSDLIRRAGIRILEGFDAERLRSLAPDLVVVGNSVSRGNPELEWLLAERRIPLVSLPALLHDRLLGRRRNIVVSGTHGKTTTATLAAFLLRANGIYPGYFIGGVPRDLPAGAAIGEPDAPFVIEGDEYDSAFFDKRSKFIHYAPRIAIVNNIEFDHADIFRDLPDVMRTFNHFLKIVPGNGAILLNADDPNIAALDPVKWAPVFRVGTAADADLRIVDFGEGPSGAGFEFVWRGRSWAKLFWGQGGLYNARNAAMAALAAALSLHPADEVTKLDLSGLSAFRGVKRRQEPLLVRPELIVLEDFGHHPTALKNLLISLRDRHPERKLTAVFEPRSNTSRRNVLRESLVAALREADEVYLGPIDRPESVPVAERLDTDGVAAELRAAGLAADRFSSNARLLERLLADTRADVGAPRLVVFFSNGSFDGIIGRYVREMGGR